MHVTGTTHPPAGATALLAATDVGVRGLGWYLVPVVVVSSFVMSVVGMGVNNLQRRWPVWWWRVGDLDDDGDREEGGGDGDEDGVSEKRVRREGERSSVTLGRGERDAGEEV